MSKAIFWAQKKSAAGMTCKISLLTTRLPLCIPQQYTLFNGQKCKSLMLMQISFKNLKVIGESAGNDWEKWEKSKTKTNLSFLLHFMLTWHLSESMFCHLNMCCALFCIFCARLRLEPKKSDSNITLVNRRPMGKSYIYIYIYWMMLVKASILWSSLWLDFDLTPG